MANVNSGVDPEYDQALHQFYAPYHGFIDVMCRLAINNNCMTEHLVNLSAMAGFEAVPLHLTFFPKLWLDIYQAQNVDRKYIAMLTNSNYFADYVESVLLDERSSLNIDVIYEFLVTYFPKVASPVLTDPTCQLMETLVNSLGKSVPAADLAGGAHKLNGEVRALSLVYSVELGVVPPPTLLPTLEALLAAIDTEPAAEESPTKKRKLDPEEKPDSTQADKETKEKCEEITTEENDATEATASCSKVEKDVINTSEDCETITPVVDWLDRLKSTVTSLRSALQQKNACDDSS